VLITNLAFAVTEKLLTDYLANSCFDGKTEVVEKVSLAKDERGSSKGFAFCQLADVNNAKRVLQLGTIQLMGRTAIVKQSKREIVEKKSVGDAGSD